jgi:type IV secretion system protein VirB8
MREAYMSQSKADFEQYQREVLSWETSRVFELEKSRAIAWRVASGASLAAIMAIGAVVGLTPLKTVRPFVIRVDNATGIVDVVSELGDAKTNYDEAINKYFVQWYVRYRQAYSADLLEDYYFAVGALSSPSEQRRYLAEIETSNPESPIRRYGKANRVRIDIKSISFLQPHVALIRYTKILEHGADQPEKTHWAATLTFQYSGTPASEKIRGINPLGFEVTDYRVDPDAAIKE